MSLSARIALTLSIVLMLGAVAAYVSYRHVFDAHFRAVERTAAYEVALEVEVALQGELDDLGRDSARLAFNDMLYNAVKRRAGRFGGSLLWPDVLRRTGLDVVLITDRDGAVSHRFVSHPDRPHVDSLRLIPGDSVNLFQLVGKGISNHSTRDEDVLAAGLLMTSEGPLLLSARALFPLTEKRDAAGYVIVGRFLGERMDEAVQERVGAHLEVWPVGFKGLPEDVAQIQDEVTSSSTPVVEILSEAELNVYATLDDIHRRPEFMIRAKMNRDIVAAGALAERSGILMTLTLGMLLMGVLLLCLRRLVLDPLSQLSHAANLAGSQEDYSVRVGTDRSDEIGDLGREFDAMLARLAEARAQVIESARAAGMSEIARGILHNAGTVLNSVNTSLSVVRERCAALPLRDFDQLTAALAEHDGDLMSFIQEDPRGVHLGDYLQALNASFQGEYAAIVGEMMQLEEGIERVCELVQSQESNAGNSTILERVQVDGVMGDLRSLVELNLPGAGSVVEFDAEEGSLDLRTDRHLLCEILLQLVQNAWESIQDFGPRAEGHRLRVLVRRELGAQIRFAVKDSGVGLDRDLATDIFELGFTTRADGSGIGLHAAANSTAVLGGTITVDSAGPGHGATFSVVLPTDGPEPGKTGVEGALSA